MRFEGNGKEQTDRQQTVLYSSLLVYAQANFKDKGSMSILNLLHFITFNKHKQIFKKSIKKAQALQGVLIKAKNMKLFDSIQNIAPNNAKYCSKNDLH